MIDNFLSVINGVINSFNSLLKQPVYSYCNLQTAVGDQTFVCDDGSMVTIIQVHGLMSILSSKDFDRKVEILSQRLDPYLKKKGYAFQVMFSSDKSSGKYEVEKTLRPSRNTLANFGADFNFLFDDWEKALCSYCRKEEMYVALWSRPELLNKDENKRERKKILEQNKDVLLGRYSQNPNAFMETLVRNHSIYVEAMNIAFTEMGYSYEILEIHDAVKLLRNQIDREYTGDGWRARLPGDKLPLAYPDIGDLDISNMLLPSLPQQIFPRDGIDIDRRTILIGENYHSPFVIDLMPQNPEIFDKLYKTLLEKEFPWRMSFLVEPDGIGKLKLFSVLSSIFAFTNSINKMYNAAIKDLEAYSLAGANIVQFSIAFDTWVHKDTPDAMAVLTKNKSLFVGAVQSWGSTEIVDVLGDPLLGVISSTAGLTPKSCAKRTAAPLDSAISMMPVERQCSPWKAGSLCFRTPEGRVYPYYPSSSLQNSWIDICSAPMGAGKSVFLNTFNFAFITQHGLTDIPYLTIIDIGPSSQGIVNLLKAALPQKANLFIYERLENHADYSINPFDTPLGYRFPTANHRSFLINLLILLCTPLDSDAPIDGVDGILSECVDKLYFNYSDKENPKLFSYGLEPEIDEIVKSNNLKKDEKTTWWEVVDELFELGYIHEAYKAQRHAMPLLEEIGAMLNEPQLKRKYQMKINDEEITQAVWRYLAEAKRSYPVFSKPTKFDLGDAKVIALDLDKVTPKEGKKAQRQSGVFYMLARFVGANKFFIGQKDVDEAPKKYREYHQQKMLAMKREPKRICYDEAHRIFKAKDQLSQQIVSDIETFARESRKWNLSIGLYSQDILDFPQIIIDLASNVFILGSNTKGTTEKLANMYKLNDTLIDTLDRIGKPNKKGSQLIAIFKTSQGPALQQILYSTLGPCMIWAFSSTAEDTAVRDALIREFGISTALRALALFQPNGSVKPIIEKMKQDAAEKGEEINAIQEVINDISQKIAQNF